MRRSRTVLLLTVAAFSPGVFGADDRHSADRHRNSAVFVDEQDVEKARLEQMADGTVTARVRRVLRPDLSGLDRPTSPDEFRQAWHQPPICQGLTGYCWAFGATSFLESEVQRRSGQKVKLSEAWAVYWEFVEKARRFVQRRGESEFPRGSEANGALAVWERYGVVPAAAYRGLPAGRSFYDDRKMYAEMVMRLEAYKRAGRWDEPAAIAGIRTILDRYLGAPPQTVEVAGARHSPRAYFQKILHVDPRDYVCIMSFMQAPWHEYRRLDVPDNWWLSADYYNVPVEEFTLVLREAVRRGGTVCLAVDDTESGFYCREDVAIVPAYDIASELIGDAARQLRFSNKSTTDDHVVHVVGCQERAGRWWYLVKDSGTSVRNGHYGGYMFYDEDYIRLKALSAMLSRSAVEAALSNLPPATPRAGRNSATRAAP